MTLGTLSTGFQHIIIECGEERFVCGGGVHDWVSWRVDQARLIRVKYFQRRCKIARQNREKVQEEWCSVVGQE